MKSRDALLACLAGLAVPLLTTWMVTLMAQPISVIGRSGAIVTNQYANNNNWSLPFGGHPTSAFVPNPATDAVIVVHGQSNNAQYFNYIYTPTNPTKLFQFHYPDGTMRQFVEPIFGAPGVNATQTGDIHANTIVDNLPSINFYVGSKIEGFGILANTFVTSILSPTSIQISQAATVTTTGVTFSFTWLLGSWLGDLGDRLINSGKFANVVFVPTAIGGTLASQWGPDGIYNGVLQAANARMRAAGLTPTMYLVGQGETECFQGLPGSAWIGPWRQIVQQSRNYGFNAKWFFALQTWNTPPGTFCSVIRQAQIDIRSTPDGILAGPDNDAFGAPFRYDGTHFNNVGSPSVGNAWNTVIQAQSFP